MRPWILLLMVITLGLVLSCEEEKFLPPKSKSGEGTFGYVYGSDTVGGSADYNDTITKISDSSFEIRMVDRVQGFLYVSTKYRVLNIRTSFTQVGVNHIFSLDDAWYGETLHHYDPDDSTSLSHLFRIDTAENNYLQIRHHWVGKLLAGTFAFNMYEQKTYGDSIWVDHNNLIKINEGRFDMRY